MQNNAMYDPDGGRKDESLSVLAAVAAVLWRVDRQWSRAHNGAYHQKYQNIFLPKNSVL